MKRCLVDVYEIYIPENGKRRDDIAETTEDFLNRDRDFRFQLQGNSLKEVAEKLSEKAKKCSL